MALVKKTATHTKPKHKATGFNSPVRTADTGLRMTVHNCDTPCSTEQLDNLAFYHPDNHHHSDAIARLGWTMPPPEARQAEII